MVYEKSLIYMMFLDLDFPFTTNIFEKKNKANKLIYTDKILKENLPQNMYQPCKDIYTLPINIK